MREYHINVFYSEQDETYIADIPDLENCSSAGSTPQKALQGALQAKDKWLSNATAEGRPVPKPYYRPALYADHSVYRWA